MASQEEKDFSANLRNRAEEEEELQTRAFAAEEECKKSFVSSNEKITASCVSESCHSGPEGRTGEFSGGNSIAAEGMRGSFDSEDLELRKKTVNGDSEGLNKEMTFLEHEMARSQIQEREVPHEKPCAERGALKDSASENILEVKKKMLLEELETALFPEGELAGEKVAGCKLVKEDSKIPRSLGIEVIDDTALIDTIPGFAMAKKNDVLGYRKCTGKDVKKEIDVRNAKRSRRKARGAKHVLGMDGKDKRVTRKDGTQRKYSREEIEAVRFVNIEEQRKIWKAIYSGLDTAVAKEYDNMACSEHQQCFAKKKEAPAVLSKYYCFIPLYKFCV